MLGHALYSAVANAAIPLGRAWCRHSAKHRAYLARFEPPAILFDAPPIWVHACSAGEVRMVRPILEGLRQRFPEIPLLLTTATQSGQTLALQEYPDIAVAWCPFDAPRLVSAFLDRVWPCVLVLAETELWPSLVRETARRQIPVAVVNARLSDKHLARYERFRAFFAPVLAQLSAVGAQDDEHARRFAALGAPSDVVRVAGNMKFDAIPPDLPFRERRRLRTQLGIPPEARVLLFGSTRPGDETLAASCWRMLRSQMPDLHLIVAPRHVQRTGEAIAEFDEPVRQRSLPFVNEGNEPVRVILLDTTGELTSFYAIADVAVVGGSFFPGVNGHNPLEPAALGVTTVFGPFMRNFAEPASVLTAGGGAIQVADPEALGAELLKLLEDPARRRQLGTLARRIVLEHQGATEQNIEMVAALIGGQ